MLCSGPFRGNGFGEIFREVCRAPFASEPGSHESQSSVHADVIFIYLIHKAEKAFDEELTFKHLCCFFSFSGPCEYRKLLHI